MAGDILDLVGEPEALLILEHAHHRKRNRHQGRLGVLGQRQGVERTIEHDLGQLLAERGVDLIEHGAGRGVRLGELGAHADGLTALPGKDECNGHGLNRVVSLICA